MFFSNKLLWRTLFILLVGVLPIAAQTIGTPGAPPDLRTNQQRMFKAEPVVTSAADTTYRTTVYTFNDITVFSYFDNTIVTVFSGATAVANWTLRADSMATFTGGNNIFRVVGNKPFTVLIGDAITNYVNGYFAVDASGLGVSTKLNTWMMTGASFDPHFIVFGYKQGTQFTIRNLKTKDIIAAGTLNEGQYYDFPNVASILGTPLQVSSNLPVSALSYTDQDYYIPSSTGLFSGNLFYGFSGYAGGWTNSVTVTSYTPGNIIAITDLVTGAVLMTDTLGINEATALSIYKDTFWKATSTGTITVANIPYAAYSGSYYYMARSADRSGRNVGNYFIVPTIASRLDVFSFEDNNFVKITRLGLYTEYPYPAPVVVDSAIIPAGSVRTINTNTGSYVYKIEATKNVSVLQSNSGAGADFMPLNFAQQYPDLAISTADISFNPPDTVAVVGDQIKVSVKVWNQGTVAVNQILVHAYEGDPDAGGIAPLIASSVIPTIGPGNFGTMQFDYVIPANPQYRQLVIKVDPFNTIVESNESNNKAIRPLKPNTDVLPPLAVNITAPNGLLLDSASQNLKPNPFRVQADIFNTGTVTATSVRAVLTLENGLKLVSGPPDTLMGNILGNGTARIIWNISASKDSSGLNLYSIRLTAGNAPTKDIKRGIYIPDIVSPAPPMGLAVTPLSGGQFVLNWTPNLDKDLAGYRVYYNFNDSIGWNGKGAAEGNSPVIVSKLNVFRLTGLTTKVKYRFIVTAFDLSNNESGASNLVTGTSEGVSAVQTPKILRIWDVPADNGKQVFIKWSVNTPAATSGIKNFAVWYWNKDSLLWVHAKGGIESLDEIVYSTVVPTIYDSTKTKGMHWSVFRVSAHGILPDQIAISQRDSGYSIDNISPAKVLNVGAERTITVLNLRWTPVLDLNNDVVKYVVYKSEIKGFAAGVANKVGEVTDTLYVDNVVDKFKTYYYRVAAIDYAGNVGTLSDEFVSNALTSVNGELSGVPESFVLGQNYPNPFNPSTTIRYGVPVASRIRIAIYNMLGQMVAQLENADRSAGYYEVQWKAAVESGIYFYRLEAYAKDDVSKNFVDVKKLMLLK